MIEKQYWRSLNELAETPEFQAYLEREFPDAVTEPPGSLERRRFLQLMGASFAFAGLTGCRWEKENILPFTRRPEDTVPGKAAYYRTAMEIAGAAIGLTVTSRDGRPVKIEGNSDHPFSSGGTTTYAQASVLELYDPDRSQAFMRMEGSNRQPTQRAEFDAFLAKSLEAWRQNEGDGLRILAPGSSSPTLARLKQEVLNRYSRARWFEFESLSTDSGREGTKLIFGEPLRALYDLDQAQVALSLDADLLGTEPGAIQMMRAWGRRRQPENGAMIRLYAVESRLSPTGAQADHRLALRFRDVEVFAAALAAEVAKQIGKTAPWSVPKADFLEGAKASKMLPAIAADLVKNRGRTAIIAGYRQSATVHAIAHFLNTELGNVGTNVVRYVRQPEPARLSHFGALRDLASDMEAGQAQTLVLLGTNPVYHAPKELNFSALMSKVSTTVHLGLHVDESGSQSTWHIPEAHYLESWGDVRSWDGTVSITQPLIKPLYGGLSAIELASLLTGGVADGQKLVRQTFDLGYALTSPAAVAVVPAEVPTPDAAKTLGTTRARGGEKQRVSRTLASAAPVAPAPTPGPVAAPGSAATETTPPPVSAAVLEALPGYQPLPAQDRAWRTALHDGFVRESGFASVVPEVKPLDLKIAAEGSESSNDFELTFYDDGKMLDGRFANNAWLQETPEFITKLTWDNAALLSPKTAERLNIKDEDVVKLSAGQETVELPALILPGQPDASIAVALGYGRRAAGVVGGHQELGFPMAGFDLAALRLAETPFVTPHVRLEKTPRKHPLAATQDHFAIDPLGQGEREFRAGRLIRAATEGEYQKHPDVIKEMVHVPPIVSIFESPKLEGHRWGLAVDLSACVGCNACVVACQSENNVPVVGKEQVRSGREMHWIRIDRYFKGPADDPEVAMQPVACVQCEAAPCEQVCPVAATVHSAEGLNDMVYNRCIGTRYCSNNCPYKVRRFNFFNYHKELDKPKNQVRLMVFNPEVTVRARGVMEKCTYCVQRIHAAKHESRLSGRPIADGDITTACAAACPSQAITFGDLADANSRVSKLHALARSYEMLEDLNIKPRTQYLAKITNPNPALKGA